MTDLGPGEHGGKASPSICEIRTPKEGGPTDISPCLAWIGETSRECARERESLD